jgi:phage shock protein PspC (stress-responsive transcriptional regulator)
VVLQRRPPPLTEEGVLVATTLTRPRQGAIIAGVCAGLAERFGWNVSVVRLLFLLSLILPGSQVIVYLVLWLLMPRRPY